MSEARGGTSDGTGSERPVADEPEGLPANSHLELTDEQAFELVVAGLPGWQRALTGLGAAVGGLLVLSGAGALGVDLFALEVLPLLAAALLAMAAQVVESGRRLTDELAGLV